MELVKVKVKLNSKQVISLLKINLTKELKMINFLIKTFIILVVLQTSLLSQEINIDKIIKNAHNSNKDVILYLHRIGCSYCNSMQEFTLEDETIDEYLKERYEIIQVNVSLKDSITYKGKKSGGICLAKNIGYDFYPSALFLNKDADIEYASVGYKNESEFLVILNYVRDDFYKEMSLREYKKQIGFSNNLDAEINDPRRHNR